MGPKPDKPLSDLARQLLVSERSSTESPALKERAVARAARALQEGQRSVGRGRMRGGRSAWGARARGGALAAAAALALAGLAAAGVRLLKDPAAEASVVPVTRPNLGPTPRAPVASSPVLTTPPSVEPPSSVASAPRARVAVPTVSAQAELTAPTRARQYAIELALLEPARSGIARGDFADALTALLRHRREFPAGQLAEERSALQVRALWGLGRVSQAEAAAAAFRQRYPRSALLSWMPQRRAPSP